MFLPRFCTLIGGYAWMVSVLCTFHPAIVCHVSLISRQSSSRQSSSRHSLISSVFIFPCQYISSFDWSLLFAMPAEKMRCKCRDAPPCIGVATVETRVPQARTSWSSGCLMHAIGNAEARHARPLAGPHSTSSWAGRAVGQRLVCRARDVDPSPRDGQSRFRHA